MPMKELRSKLQLSLPEYVDTWQGLTMEFYRRGMSDNQFFEELALTEEASARFSMEYATVLLVLAMRIWNGKRRMSDSVKSMVTAGVAEAYYREFSGEDQELVRACMNFYEMKYRLFSDICKNLAGGDAEKRKVELVGFARYLTGQTSQREESANGEAIKRLSLILMDAAAAFLRLAENSAQDSGGILGKPKFIVQQ